MEQNKIFDKISIMRAMAMTMIVAFHSLCFYYGRRSKNIKIICYGDK